MSSHDPSVLLGFHASCVSDEENLPPVWSTLFSFLWRIIIKINIQLKFFQRCIIFVCSVKWSRKFYCEISIRTPMNVHSPDVIRFKPHLFGRFWKSRSEITECDHVSSCNYSSSSSWGVFNQCVNTTTRCSAGSPDLEQETKSWYGQNCSTALKGAIKCQSFILKAIWVYRKWCICFRVTGLLTGVKLARSPWGRVNASSASLSSSFFV